MSKKDELFAGLTPEIWLAGKVLPALIAAGYGMPGPRAGGLDVASLVDVTNDIVRRTLHGPETGKLETRDPVTTNFEIPEHDSEGNTAEPNRMAVAAVRAEYGGLSVSLGNFEAERQRGELPVVFLERMSDHWLVVVSRYEGEETLSIELPDNPPIDATDKYPAEIVIRAINPQDRPLTLFG